MAGKHMKSHQRTSDEGPFGVFPPCLPARTEAGRVKRTEHTSSGRMCGGRFRSGLGKVHVSSSELTHQPGNIWSLNLFPL